jgi:hypothetical protein
VSSRCELRRKKLQLCFSHRDYIINPRATKISIRADLPRQNFVQLLWLQRIGTRMWTQGPQPHYIDSVSMLGTAIYATRPGNVRSGPFVTLAHRQPWHQRRSLQLP